MRITKIGVISKHFTSLLMSPPSMLPSSSFSNEKKKQDRTQKTKNSTRAIPRKNLVCDSKTPNSKTEDPTIKITGLKMKKNNTKIEILSIMLQFFHKVKVNQSEQIITHQEIKGVESVPKQRPEFSTRWCDFRLPRLLCGQFPLERCQM